MFHVIAWSINSSQIVTDSLYIPLPSQTPQENLRLVITVQIPPLQPPVTSSTPPNPLNIQMSHENITTIDYVINRFAWQSTVPSPLLLNSTRWSALSVVGGGTYFESREVYYGPLAETVKELYGVGLQEGFVAEGVAMKERAEGMVLT